MIDYHKISEEELDKELEKKYGSEWSIRDLNPEQQPDKEFLRRIEEGVAE